MAFARSGIVRPHSVAASLTPHQVAVGYNYPVQFTGKGAIVGIIELGGGFTPSDFPGVVSVSVAGGQNRPDGPDGADGEVQLDIGIVAAVAPDAKIRVYFAPNSDSGFLAACRQACAECDVVSISWGQAESQWARTSMMEFDGVFAAARSAGVPVFVAAGDSGANDGTGSPHVDFPASSPNVIGCGGTRLELNSDGTRASEVTWNDNPTRSATGGGVSTVFPGRQVPDVAGNADPQTGYQVLIDGNRYVIGGTSAVAPLYAGLVALLTEALGRRAGSVADFLTTVVSNPTVAFDVTAGDNGAYRAGPGRDQTTGFGVVDGDLILNVYRATQIPAPPPAPPQPTGTAVTRTFPSGTPALDAWASSPHIWRKATAAKKEWDGSVLSGAWAPNNQHPDTETAKVEHYHDAGTGRYVTEEYATEFPKTTYKAAE